MKSSPLLLTILPIIFIGCSNDETAVNELEIFSDQWRSQFVAALRSANERNDLGWDVAYREGLLKQRRPVGFVFEYSATFKEAPKLEADPLINFCVHLICPESILREKRLVLLLDEEQYQLSGFEIIVHWNELETGVDGMACYEVKLSEFLASGSVSIQLDDQTDALIPNAGLFSEKILAWIEKGRSGDEEILHAIWAAPVRFSADGRIDEFKLAPPNN